LIKLGKIFDKNNLPLISRIKEREKFLLLANLGKFDPLFSSGVNSGRVMGTGVEEYNSTRGSI